MAIIGIIAAIAVPGLLRARQSGSEASAIGSMRAINSAQSSFASSCGFGYYSPNLSNLGTGPGSTVGVNAFISPDLGSAATVQKTGCAVTMGSSGGVVTGAPASCNGLAASQVVQGYFATATPSAGGGTLAFGTNTVGTIYAQVGTTALAMTDSAAPAGASPIQ